MVSDLPGAALAEADTAVPLPAPSPLPPSLIERADGIFAEAGVLPADLLAAVRQVYLSGRFLAGLDYSALIKIVYDSGPALTLVFDGGKPQVRLASAAPVFDPQRRALYKAPKLHEDSADYFFELLYFPELELPDGTVIPERPAKLDADEFVAELWLKGIFFGIDIAAINGAIASGKSERITVARQLDPTPGQDAMVVEVSSDLHRSDAPRAKADGRVDLLSFQNRFPQIKKGMRLLMKQPWVAGLRGIAMAGQPLLPEQPKDVELKYLCGDGTTVEKQAGGEFLIAVQDGFLSVDTKSGRISVNDKIISLEGVSGRTTGNLELAGAYEEFGDVQEMRDVTGGDIVVHGHVYGNITSRGGQVTLDGNLVGGSVINANGNIEVKGTASGATIQSRSGTVTVGRAENCVISATKVVIESASNCEIIADDLVVELAEGCAIAGRNLSIESAGPRRRTEMLLFVLVRDLGQITQELVVVREKAATQRLAVQELEQENESVSLQPDVRRYLALAAKLRNQELTLTAEQATHLRKIAGGVGAELQTLTRLRAEIQVAQTQMNMLSAQVDQLVEQRKKMAGIARCGLRMASGEVLVRTMPFNPDGPPLYQLSPKDIQLRLRGTVHTGKVLFAESSGALDWHLDPAED